MSGAATPAPRPLRANLRANVLGNVGYAVGLWAQLVLLARLGGPAGVGAYAFALALVQPALLLSQLQLRALLASDARGAWTFREYRALRLLTTGAALAALVPIAAAAGAARAGWAMVAAVALQGAADALSDVYCGLWQRHERMGTAAWTLAVNAAASVAFMATAALLGGGPSAMALGGALGSAAALLFVHRRTVADPALRAPLADRAPLDRRRLLRLAREAAPLGAIVLLGSLQVNAPRYAIERGLGPAALGLFAAAAQLTAAGMVVVQALGNAAAPRLARACAAGDPAAFARLTRRLALAGAALGGAGILLSALAGRPVLALVFGERFAAAHGVLVVLSAAAGLGFVATLLGYALTAARVLVAQAAVLATTLALTAAACALLVPRLGAAGGAWALALAALVQAGWSALALRRLRVRAPARVEPPSGPGGTAARLGGRRLGVPQP